MAASLNVELQEKPPGGPFTLPGVPEGFYPDSSKQAVTEFIRGFDATIEIFIFF